MKALGLVVSDKQIFENCILKTKFWPRDLLMQPTGTVWTTLIGDHPGIIPVKFGQNPIQIKCCLKKFLTHARTGGRTDGQTMDDGQWAITKAHIVLRWAKKGCFWMSVASSCSTRFCVVLCVGFWTGYFVTVPLILTSPSIVTKLCQFPISF